jgi:hypothetical protein
MLGRVGVISSIFVISGSLFGCSPGGAAPKKPPPPSVTSRQIRSFDFGNAEWYDSGVLQTVQLKDGGADRGEGSPLSGGGRWRLLDAPQFADVDGDGDEDAAAGLATSGEQSANTAWYIWLWQDGTARQLRRPIVSTTRCDRPIDGVRVVPGGFEVRMFMFTEGDACAGGGVTPVTYVAAVRGGWPVRISPDFGPIAGCDPLALTVQVRLRKRIQLRVDADARAPAVEPAAVYDSILAGELTMSPYLRIEDVGEWALVIAVRDGKRICGFVRTSDIR